MVPLHMMFSVYNYATKLYDYYEGGGRKETHAGAPPRPLGARGAVSPEAAAWRLPWGAKKVGSGQLPKGRIASSGVHLGGMGDVADVAVPVALLVAGLYVVKKVIR